MIRTLGYKSALMHKLQKMSADQRIRDDAMDQIQQKLKNQGDGLKDYYQQIQPLIVNQKISNSELIERMKQKISNSELIERMKQKKTAISPTTVTYSRKMKIATAIVL